MMMSRRAVLASSAAVPLLSSTANARLFYNPTGVQQRWNPGVYAGTYLGDGQSQFASYLSASGNLRGIWHQYRWKDIETSFGVYDLTQIKSDLDYLNSFGKKLIVVIRSGGYNPNENNCPSYLTGHSYGGGTYVNTNDVNQVNPVFWNDAVAERLVALALAISALDGHPAFEAFLPMEESAPKISSVPPGNPGVEKFLLKGWRRNYLNLGIATRTNFIQTQTWCHLNYPSIPDKDNCLATWSHVFRKAGIGISSVDVLPYETSLTEPGASYSHITAASARTATAAYIDYMDFDADTVANMYAYAITSLKVSHFACLAGRNDPPPNDFWSQFIEIFSSYGPTGGCVTRLR